MNFTQVFIPRQLPCVRLTGQPGGGPKGCLLIPSHREKAHLQTTSDHTWEGSPPVLFSYTGDNPQESLKPKHIYKRGADKRATWKCCLGVPSFLLPLVPTWKRRKKQGQSWNSMTLIMTLHTPVIQHKEAQLSPRCRSALPRDSRERRQESRSAVGRAKGEGTNRQVLSHPGPIRGPAGPFFVSAHPLGIMEMIFKDEPDP